jgi:hypothetical protein
MRLQSKALFLSLITGLLLTISSQVQADYSAILEQEWSIDRKGKGQKFETLFEPQYTRSLSNNIEMTFIGRVRFDAFDNLGIPKEDEKNYGGINGSLLASNHSSFSIREWYVDTEIADSFWRIGKQQVVWGQADGLKVLDVVNPQSYREFILDDFDDSRLPLWMLNVEIPVGGDDSLQLLWIPDLSYNEYAISGGVYQATSSLLVPKLAQGIELVGLHQNKPSSVIKDSDFGMRYATFYQGWDLTFNYFYHFLDVPVNYQFVEQNKIFINAEYERSHLIGGTASKAFGDFTLRTEVGYSSDSFHLLDKNSANFLTKQGIHQSADISSVVGLDFQGLTDIFISAQWFQSYLLDDEVGLFRPQHDNTFSLIYNQSFANEVWKFEALVLHGQDKGDGSIQAKLSYMLESNIKLWLGTDTFYGNKSGLFGQFKKTNRVNIGIEWGF